MTDETTPPVAPAPVAEQPAQVPFGHRVRKQVCHLGAAAEHPLAVIYAIFDALEMHGILVVISYGLFGAGILAIIYSKFFAEGGE